MTIVRQTRHYLGWWKTPNILNTYKNKSTSVPLHIFLDKCCTSWVLRQGMYTLPLVPNVGDLLKLVYKSTDVYTHETVSYL